MTQIVDLDDLRHAQRDASCADCGGLVQARCVWPGDGGESSAAAGTEAKAFAITIENEGASTTPTMPLAMMGTGSSDFHARENVTVFTAT
jgi:hypothetical protein